MVNGHRASLAAALSCAALLAAAPMALGQGVSPSPAISSQGPAQVGTSTEIPGKAPQPAASAAQPAASAAPPTAFEQQPQNEPAVNEYQSAQNPISAPQPLDPRLYSLQDFVSQGSDQSPIGVELREDRTKLKSGQEVTGLAVISVRKDSPAAKAGLKSYSGAAHLLLDGATVAAALFFPPAIVAVTIIDQTRVGESFDLIIAIDGRRVRNVLDFEDVMREDKPGDTVYLTVVRGGQRMQVKVLIPQDSASAR